jgi:hypothetical protein
MRRWTAGATSHAALSDASNPAHPVYVWARARDSAESPGIMPERA